MICTVWFRENIEKFADGIKKHNKNHTGRYENGELFLKHSRSIWSPIIKMANFFEVIKMANNFLSKWRIFKQLSKWRTFLSKWRTSLLSKWRTFFIKMANFDYHNGELRSALFLKMANFQLLLLNVSLWLIRLVVSNSVTCFQSTKNQKISTTWLHRLKEE